MKTLAPSNRAALTAIVAFVLGIIVAAGYPRVRDAIGEHEVKHEPEKLQQAAAGGLASEVRFPPGSAQLQQVRTTTATLSDVPLVEPLAARFAYDETRTTRVSSPIAGRIQQLLVEPGTVVKAGQALARIDSPDFGLAVSDVEKARADEDRKSAAFKRSQAMFEAGVLARRDLEGAEADFRQAQAETRRARGRLANLHGLRGSTGGSFDLVSPIAGVVVDRHANPGMEVRPDLPDPLFIVSDLRQLWVLIDVPEPALHSVSVGSPVTLEVAAYPGREFTGKVGYVSPVLDPATRRVQARATIENTQGLLRPEMYAKAVVSTTLGRRAVRFPITALISAGERSYVFVETSDGVFARRDVRLAAQSRDYAYASSGLEVSDRVVTVGAMLLASEAGAGQ